MCFVCNQPIVRGGAGLRGKFYHNEHFVCSEPTCNRSLRGIVCFEKDDQLYCERDYHEKFKALGKTFHRIHFFCSHCGENFGPEDRFREYDGKAYCEEDYAMLFAQRTVLTAEGFYDYNGEPFCEFHYYQKGSNICDACRKPIIGRCVVAIDKKFHPMHFVCSFCQTNLDGQGYKERNAKPYCGSCYIKLFC
ncbi:hypothetical protein HK105_201568 [Polyrhizophydium stewartii]|uniref:LIM zinc-binding domain-containing protein n=1 Tax=Polyrhizophydium stewartii TaxID=2732419 RepID=A0ABR4NH05_9FUNG